MGMGAGMRADRMRFAGARRHPMGMQVGMRADRTVLPSPLMMMRAGKRAGRTVPPSPLMMMRARMPADRTVPPSRLMMMRAGMPADRTVPPSPLMMMRAGMRAGRTVPPSPLMMMRAGMPADRMRFAGTGWCWWCLRSRRDPPQRMVSSESTKRSKRYWLSWGPGLASGWYWTVKTGRSRWARPYTDPSLTLTWLTVKPLAAGMVVASTWKPWFWEVI